MGKSFNKDKKNYGEKNERSNNDFKRRRNQVKEEHSHEDHSDYKIHGFNRNKSRY